MALWLRGEGGALCLVALRAGEKSAAGPSGTRKSGGGRLRRWQRRGRERDSEVVHDDSNVLN